ncbi:rho GTPase-activating protein 44-like [Diaphorina citri]|uniref:Rho GTPase-activating protein 44-like n=1 Tax=Diaphorina citri TaxID=121845 RepID=A0A3Q0JCA9_DIACI|nr:rho GTPase-activating protein 44-like [Diaphorina citri]
MLNANVNKELDDDLLRNVISACTKLELNLAQVSQQLETDIELDIVQKLNLVVDKDLTNVAKLKTTLKKCILDMDSARSRYQAACRNSSANGNTKADSIKEELEEAETKVEQCRVS